MIRRCDACKEGIATKYVGTVKLKAFEYKPKQKVGSIYLCDYCFNKHNNPRKWWQFWRER